jgi:hypothetical protein
MQGLPWTAFSGVSRTDTGKAFSGLSIPMACLELTSDIFQNNEAAGQSRKGRTVFLTLFPRQQTTACARTPYFLKNHPPFFVQLGCLATPIHSLPPPQNQLF